MAKVIGKEQLCCADLRYFKSVQGMSGKTLFDRYKLAEASVINKHIDAKYQNFLAYPLQDENDTVTFFGKASEETPQLLSELQGDDLTKYNKIKSETLAYYDNKIDSLRNAGKITEADFLADAVKYVDDRFVYCYDDKVVLGIWGMQLRNNIKEDINTIRKNLVSKTKKTPFPIRFNAGENGSFNGKAELSKYNNEIIETNEVPSINPKSGFEFIGWNTSPYGFVVTGEMEFVAQYRKIEQSEETFTVHFNGGEGGDINGNRMLNKHLNDVVYASEIPAIIPEAGYEFIGWDTQPNNHVVSDNIVFTAQYRMLQPEVPSNISPTNLVEDITTQHRETVSPIIPPVVDRAPWYRRGCFGWLLRILLFLLLLFLLLWLLLDCFGRAYNPHRPTPTPPQYVGILPPYQGVLPPIDDEIDVIIPGNPAIVANRLNILLTNEDRTIFEFARAFNEQYPELQILYFSEMINRMQISVPPEERVRLKSEIPSRFAPEFDVFVFDESLFETQIFNDPALADPDKSWHLHAIRAPQAWRDITTGSQDIVIAIVDDGFNLRHPEFRNRIVNPFNTWQHSGNIPYWGRNHGTHVAGIALATANNRQGIAGIAPNSRFMPVQVGDRQGRMTFTSVLDGILFAIHQGADVVNVSLGKSFRGLGLSEREQQEMKNSAFLYEERVWREVMRIAEARNTTIVIAAGNCSMLAGIDPKDRPELFIVVSAVDREGNGLVKADFSNFGPRSTISAPGVDIYSSYGRGYRTLEGTSMAAPIVTGAVALMKSLNRELTTPEIICILQGTGIEVQNNIGNMIQLDRALEAVLWGEEIDCIPIPSTGDVQVLLRWHNYNDLDLIVVDPFGDEVWFANRQVASGGQLEIDMNAGGNNMSRTPVENIFWPLGTAPLGTYEVFVLFFSNREDVRETPFTVEVRYGGRTQIFSGVMTDEDLMHQIFIGEFTLE